MLPPASLQTSIVAGILDGTGTLVCPCVDRAKAAGQRCSYLRASGGLDGSPRHQSLCMPPQNFASAIAFGSHLRCRRPVPEA